MFHLNHKTKGESLFLAIFIFFFSFRHLDLLNFFNLELLISSLPLSRSVVDPESK